MWQRGMNWAAIVIVGTFGLMWLGIVIYADVNSGFWLRFAQAALALVLLGWAVRKAAVMISKA